MKLPLQLSERKALLVLADLAMVTLAILFALWLWTLRDPRLRFTLDKGSSSLLRSLWPCLLTSFETDAFLLDTKPGVVMWMIMGLVTGLYLKLAPEHLATSEHG